MIWRSFLGKSGPHVTCSGSYRACQLWKNSAKCRWCAHLESNGRHPKKEISLISFNTQLNSLQINCPQGRPRMSKEEAGCTIHNYTSLSNMIPKWQVRSLNNLQCFEDFFPANGQSCREVFQLHINSVAKLLCDLSLQKAKNRLLSPSIPKWGFTTHIKFRDQYVHMVNNHHRSTLMHFDCVNVNLYSTIMSQYCHKYDTFALWKVRISQSWKTNMTFNPLDSSSVHNLPNILTYISVILSPIYCKMGALERNVHTLHIAF